MAEVKGKVVWITGASSGIGEAITYEMARKGAKLILSARRQEELERVKAACVASVQGLVEENVKILTVDLANAASLEAKAKEAEAMFGVVDVLVNNGGISQRSLAKDTQLEVDRKVMEVNYFGAIALSKALLPGMISRKNGHHVVISSAVGIISSPYRTGYAASKHALHGFYDGLRAELHDDSIKVTIICPGFIRTQISVNSVTGDGGKFNEMDDAQANGIAPEAAARTIVRAVEKEKEEVYIGGVKEVGGIYVKRFFPSLFSQIVRKVKVR
ncbi:SDR family oxidoreductase [uncultured Imperialibacter sp.]|uniref:SDR family oxidoreductase n=1 Tax=uncultured Imperialibacter sp. TaxID=1672639 RepID=UPI0030DB8BBF|tara:strand:- start:52960 stop:53775 length:816 start_codon:yes stop_codon:yes gene_type:complete